MLYLIPRLENPIWARRTHKHTHIGHIPLLILCDIKREAVIVSSLLALKMALSCIQAVRIRNMAREDTRYHPETQVINAVIESFFTPTIIVI